MSYSSSLTQQGAFEQNRQVMYFQLAETAEHLCELFSTLQTLESEAA